MGHELAYLRITRVKREDGLQEYHYEIPAGTFTQTRNQQSRLDLESCLEVAAQQVNSPPRPEAGEESFSVLGDIMGQRYMPSQVLAYLFGASTPLLIETDDPEFPWELVRYQGKILGVYRPVGRTIAQRREILPGIERWGAHRHAMLIGVPGQDLHDTGAEIRDLQHLLHKYREPYKVTIVPHAEAASTALLRRLGNEHGCELLHFAGHGQYNEHHHGASGILCADGKLLTADDIMTLGADFAFVFLNVCKGARAAQTQDPALRSLAVSGVVVNGLATAFLLSGASAYISPLWPVDDTSAHEFARLFYEQACRGITFGETLRWVRDRWRAQHPYNATWAAYVLYGNPLMTLETVRDPHGLGHDATAEIERAHDSVLFRPITVEAQGRFRQTRVDRFFHHAVADDSITLDYGAQKALELTLRWVDQMSLQAVAQLDLLVGLALVPHGMVARGLKSVGSSPKQVCVLNARLFGRGKHTAELPIVSAGVRQALQRAARLARSAGRSEVTEDDLAAGLLDLEDTGSLRLAMELIECDGRTLLAAARGQRVSEAPAHQQVSSRVFTTAEEAGAKRDATTHNLLRDLRAEVQEALRGAGVPPFVGRQSDLRAVLRILTNPSQPDPRKHHVVVRGPAGVGARALAYQLAIKVVTDPRSLDVAALADWDLFGVRLAKDLPKVGELLREEVLDQAGRRGTLLLLEDLPAYLAFEGVPQLMRELLNHAKVRCLATSRYDAYQAVLMDFPEIARLLTPIDLTAPRPQDAVGMVRVHLPHLERKYAVTIEQEAAQVAVDLWPHEKPLVLPGAAIARLDQACAWVVSREIEGQTDSEKNRQASPRESQGNLRTNEPAPRRTVTASDVRAVPRHFDA